MLITHHSDLSKLKMALSEIL